MPLNIEIRVTQKRMLYSLMKVQKFSKGINNEILEEEINALQTEMEKEDVAYVNERISNLKTR